jgi:hypothetical protein
LDPVFSLGSLACEFYPPPEGPDILYFIINGRILLFDLPELIEKLLNQCLGAR